MARGERRGRSLIRDVAGRDADRGPEAELARQAARDDEPIRVDPAEPAQISARPADVDLISREHRPDEVRRVPLTDRKVRLERHRALALVEGGEPETDALAYVLVAERTTR